MNTAVLGPALGLFAAGAGVLLLRSAWRKPHPALRTVLGWVSIGAATAAWALGAAWDKALTLALLSPCAIALVVVAAGVRLRPQRVSAREKAPMLPDHSGENVWRALVRTLYAGPLAALAAGLLSAAWALHGSGSPAYRLVIAGFLAPVLWAIGLIWSTTDPRLFRIGGGLCALAVGGGLWAAL